MIRTAALLLALSASPSLAQTLDVISLPDGIDLTITRDGQTGTQALVAGDTTLLSAPVITRDLIVTDMDGEPAAVVLYADNDDAGCAPAAWVVTVEFGTPWARGPIGHPCLPYVATARPGMVTFVSQPDLAQPGDAITFSIDEQIVRLGPIVYAPQAGRGWDALDGEVGGYNDLSTLDLYAAQPVYDALWVAWEDELAVFARHLGSRTIPVIEGDFLLQTGCLPGQCAFAIGMLAVDPAQEVVYSAFLNEGAPAIRPQLDEWSPAAQAVYERWAAGEFR
ncbi:MAG: hypothetical protein ACE360_11425 [Hyphomicrobiales bacterium]